jgi:hypothetical protein
VLNTIRFVITLMDTVLPLAAPTSDCTAIHNRRILARWNPVASGYTIYSRASSFPAAANQHDSRPLRGHRIDLYTLAVSDTYQTSWRRDYVGKGIMSPP